MGNKLFGSSNQENSPPRNSSPRTPPQNSSPRTPPRTPPPRNSQQNSRPPNLPNSSYLLIQQQQQELMNRQRARDAELARLKQLRFANQTQLKQQQQQRKLSPNFPNSSYLLIQQQQELMNRQRARNAELAQLKRLRLQQKTPQSADSKKREQEARIKALNVRRSKLSGGKRQIKKHTRSKKLRVKKRA